VWFEDVDFCRRAYDAGYRIEYVPNATAHHSGGHSVQRLPTKHQRVYWYDSLLRYAGKHHRSLPYRTVCCSVAIGSLLRMSTGMIFGRGEDSRGEFNEVFRLAVSKLVAGRSVCPPAAERHASLESHPVDGR
jgi:hypothetical protein